jgi:hypothetical protein
MIENRHRIEKEILLGRKAVRKSVQSRIPTLLPDITHGTIPEPSTSTRLPRTSLSPAPMGSDVPLSVDTDAETAYANGSYSSFRRCRPVDTSEISTPRDSDNTTSRDPLRSPLIRRKWASDLLDVRLSDSEGSDKSKRHRSPPASNQMNPPASPGGFFTRLRTSSFPTLSSPFSAMRRSNRLGMEPSRHSSTDLVWSSDSSSSEDPALDDQRRLHHPSTLNFHKLDATDEVDADADSDAGGKSESIKFRP